MTTASDMLIVEHVVTTDLDDGAPVVPGFIDDGVAWRVVRRANGCTMWRRLFLSHSPATDWRSAPGDQMRVPCRRR